MWLDIALGIVGAKLIWMIGTLVVFGVFAIIGLIADNIKQD
jgi:hypothetical protein